MISQEELAAASAFYSSEHRDQFLTLDHSSIPPEALFSFSKSSLILFLQDNLSGPPLNLPRTDLPDLQLEGEETISYMSGGIYLLAASKIFTSAFSLILSFPDAHLWRARYAFTHQQVLIHPVQFLKDLCLESYSQVPHTALTYIEYSRCLLYYSQYDQAESALISAETQTGIQYNLTGKLGVRTKFQKSKTPQLVLSVRSTIDSDLESLNKPTSVALDDDCPLRETPLLDEETREIVSLEDQVLLLGWVHYFFKTRPAEELQAEVIASYLDKILQKSMDWLVYSQALLYRSKNQFSSVKYKERSALQINTLVEQFSDKEPVDRLAYAFSVGYPLRHWMKVELGEMFMKLGAVMSAFQEFENVQMWEEAVECLIMGSSPNKAAEIARREIARRETPRMLCALGDITGEYEHYMRAWEVSGNRCTRAQRTLAKREFDKGNYEQAIEHYRKALEINPLYPNAWFTMGCAFMRMKNWQQAQIAFQRLVCIDSNLAEGWNNLAACHMSMANYTEAYDALVHGIKHDRTNWKMLENLLIISVQLQKFFTALECVRMLLKLTQNKLLDGQLFGVMNRIAGGKEKKLEEVYVEMVNSISVSPGVWKCYGDFVENCVGMDGFTWDRVLDLRVKACRNASTGQINLNNVEELEEMTRDLARAYSRIESDKVRYEGKLFINSLCRKIRDATGRELVIDNI